MDELVGGWMDGWMWCWPRSGSTLSKTGRFPAAHHSQASGETDFPHAVLVMSDECYNVNFILGQGSG